MIPSDDDIVFADEAPDGGAPTTAGIEPWTVLVVDDDQDVHAMTRFLLSDLRFRDRPLRLLHAFSAAQAETVLREDQAIALILLDVVMETDDAGLRLARRIRDDLANQIVRIVLRTGQPGVAPERLVLLDYDINDYKAKTELTADRMFTTVVTALRTYETIKALMDEQQARRLADQEAEAHRATILAMEKRRADERKAELDAIAQHLGMIILPGLRRAADQAKAIPGIARMMGRANDDQDGFSDALIDVGSSIAGHLDTMSDDVGELLQTLSAVR